MDARHVSTETSREFSVSPGRENDTDARVTGVRTPRDITSKRPSPSNRQGVWVLRQPLEVRGTTSLTSDSCPCREQGLDTGIDIDNFLPVVLQSTANAGASGTFAFLARAMDWRCYPPEQLLRAVDLALGLGVAGLAIELSQLGGRLFPNNQRVQHMAAVLSPPVVRRTATPRAEGLEESRAWLRENAHRYSGQWVAVRCGELLGVSEHLRDLGALIMQDPASTIVTQVL